MGIAAIFAVLERSNISGSLVGLSISYALQVSHCIHLLCITGKSLASISYALHVSHWHPSPMHYRCHWHQSPMHYR